MNSYGYSSSSGDSLLATQKPNPITLTITLPSNNGIISKSDTLVKGTVVNSIGSETGVVVNGFIAKVYGSEFVANHVPLASGPNTIAATATDVSGNTQTASVTVNAVSTGDYINITATPESGISPLQTIFSLESSLDLKKATITCSGPGTVEFLSTDVSGIKAKMVTEGIYYCTATVNDSSGTFYNDTVAISVLSKIQLDNLLRAKWEGMRAKLSGGDIEGALVFLDDSVKQAYRDLLNILSAVLPTIAEQISNIQFIEYMGEATIYDIRTNQDGIEYSFQLLFMKDMNGFWWINSF
jgi:hypothetical protein